MTAELAYERSGPERWLSSFRLLAELVEALGPERSALITHVSADGADFIDSVVAEHAPNAVRVADPFHVVKVRHEALCVRVGVRDLHRRVVAAAGLKLRAA